MKSPHFSYIAILGLILMLPIHSFSQSSSGNPHEFSIESWEFTERCNPCHIYNSETNASSANNFLMSFESDSLSAPDSLYLSGISKLCYTCHDGTVAGYTHSSPFLGSNVGNNAVSNAHPVSVKYQFSKANKTKLHNPDSTSSGLGGTITDDMLKNGRIECTSCHDAHFSMQLTACSSCPPAKPNAESKSNYLSLWVTNKKSALCFICHKI